MIYSENSFIGSIKLKEELTKEEIYYLINKAQDGDLVSRNKIIEHNLKLVTYRICTKFKNLNYTIDELVSVGTLGLIKAVKLFDTKKEFNFSVYAITCIDNEILMMLRKNKNNSEMRSLSDIIIEGENNIILEDLLTVSNDFTEDIEAQELYEKLREIIKKLPEREQNIIISCFGLYNNKKLSQRELASKLHISQAQISKLLHKVLNEIKEELINNKFIEETNKIKTKNDIKH